MNVLESSLKRGPQARTLLELEKGVMIDGQNVHVEPNALFSSQFVRLERCEDAKMRFRSSFSNSLIFP